MTTVKLDFGFFICVLIQIKTNTILIKHKKETKDNKFQISMFEINKEFEIGYKRINIFQKVFFTVRQLQISDTLLMEDNISVMVKLGFQTKIEAPLCEVWGYYSNFENIVEWDPNTTYCKMTKSSQSRLQVEYTLKSVFNCNESTLIYKITHFQQGKSSCRLTLVGKNQNVECFDDIVFTALDERTTMMVYQADICLRGIKVLFTPFIMGPLKKIEEDCKNGVEKRNKIRWGGQN